MFIFKKAKWFVLVSASPRSRACCSEPGVMLTSRCWAPPSAQPQVRPAGFLLLVSSSERAPLRCPGGWPLSLSVSWPPIPAGRWGVRGCSPRLLQGESPKTALMSPASEQVLSQGSGRAGTRQLSPLPPRIKSFTKKNPCLGTGSRFVIQTGINGDS